MQRQKYLKDIADLLATLSMRIEYENKIRFTDLNISAENFYKELLNLIFGYNLKDINIETSSSPAIDLGDQKASIAIQVTSDSASSKIKTTIKKFIERNLYAKYKTLKFYIITHRQRKYKTKFNTKGHFGFNAQDDVLDTKDLMEVINTLDIIKIKEISGFLEKEIGFRSLKQKSSVANEVTTIMELIELLSVEGDAVASVKIGNPDPEHKIYKRFSDYTDFLITELKDYIPQYKCKKEEAEKVLGMDAAKTGKICRYLKTVSDDLLRKSKNNPQKALDSLVKMFEKKLSSSGNSYDFGAIRYYLLDQIIKCNVFPNEL